LGYKSTSVGPTLPPSSMKRRGHQSERENGSTAMTRHRTSSDIWCTADPIASVDWLRRGGRTSSPGMHRWSAWWILGAGKSPGPQKKFMATSCVIGWRRRRGETTIPSVGRSESTEDNLWCYLRLVAASPGRNRALDHRNASPEWELSHAVARTVGSSCRDTTHGNNTPI
jgi:hypothetical protein